MDTFVYYLVWLFLILFALCFILEPLRLLLSLFFPELRDSYGDDDCSPPGGQPPFYG